MSAACYLLITGLPLLHRPRRRSELFDLLHHIRQRHDLGKFRFLFTKADTVQYESALQQLNRERRVHAFGAGLRTRARHVTLIWSVEGVNCGETFLESAVAVIGGVAIGLG